MKILRFLDYINYVFDGHYMVLYFPFLWIAVPIAITLKPEGLGWLALFGPLLVMWFVVYRFFEKREVQARQYFKGTKYSQPFWKRLTYISWLLFWFFVPLFVWIFIIKVE